MNVLTNDPIIQLVFISILLGITILLTAILTRPRYKKVRVLTEGEYRFFIVLHDAIGKLFFVFPQVRLANIVGLKGLFLWHHFRPLGGKCIDFVLVDKISGETVLVIELDDKSHQRFDRRRRDYFINYVLRDASIPILHEKYQAYYDSNQLAKRIQNAIQSPTHPIV